VRGRFQFGEEIEVAERYVERNRETWTRLAADFAVSGERNWAQAEPTWGIFDVPESEVGMFPDDVAAMDAIELGCGTAYVSAWLAQRGARPVGIDITPAQLETARRLQDEHDIHFPLHEGNAEATPFADASADLVISEYGASIWCDPYKWIPEAHRLLRPGGFLRFYRGSVLTQLCSPLDPDAPVGTELIRDHFGLYRINWGADGVEFSLPHGELVRLLIETGFEIEGLVEIQVPADATTRYPYMTAEWAHRWPCEEAWKARKR
jgi:SAM-dependent methyltransferase